MRYPPTDPPGVDAQVGVSLGVDAQVDVFDLTGDNADERYGFYLSH